MALPVTVAGILQPIAQHGSFLGPFLSGCAVYVAGIDSADVTGAAIHKSSNPDLVAFAEQDAANRPTAAAVHFDCIWITQVGSDLHVLTQDDNSTVKYSVFHMATDLWDGTIVDELVTSTPDDTQIIGGAIVRSNGDVIVVYQGQQDSFHGSRSRVDYARREGGTWTVDIAVDNGGAADWKPGTTVLGTDDRAHIFFSDLSNTDAYQRTLNSANVLETFPTALSTTTVVGQITFASGGARYNDCGILRVRATFKESGPLMSVAKLDSTSDAPTVTVDTDVLDNIVLSLGKQPGADLSADGTTLHFLYVKTGSPGDRAIQHDENPDDAGWGVDDVELVVGTAEKVWSNVYASVSTVNNRATVLAYLYVDGATDILRYNERVLHQSRRFFVVT